MGPAVYILGFLTTLVCSILLMRGYLRTRTRLLLWSAICFCGLAASNLLIFFDLVLFPNLDLYLWRLLTAAIAMLVLVVGLIWEGTE
jgi:hypothetical protein